MKKVVIALFLCLPIAGCHNTAMAPTPPLINQVNTFDGDSYRALITVQAALNSLKTSITNDPADLSVLKAALNQAINDYDAAETVWSVYHTTQANQAAVTAALTKVQTDITNLSSQVSK